MPFVSGTAGYNLNLEGDDSNVNYNNPFGIPKNDNTDVPFQTEGLNQGARIFIAGYDVTADITNLNISHADEGQMQCTFDLANPMDKYILTRGDIQTFINSGLIGENADPRYFYGNSDIHPLYASYNSDNSKIALPFGGADITRDIYAEEDNFTATTPIDFKSHDTTSGYKNVSPDTMFKHMLFVVKWYSGIKKMEGDYIFDFKEPVIVFLQGRHTPFWYFGFTGFMTTYNSSWSYGGEPIISITAESRKYNFGLTTQVTNPSVYRGFRLESKNQDNRADKNISTPFKTLIDAKPIHKAILSLLLENRYTQNSNNRPLIPINYLEPAWKEFFETDMSDTTITDNYVKAYEENPTNDSIFERFKSAIPNLFSQLKTLLFSESANKPYIEEVEDDQERKFLYSRHIDTTKMYDSIEIDTQFLGDADTVPRSFIEKAVNKANTAARPSTNIASYLNSDYTDLLGDNYFQVYFFSVKPYTTLNAQSILDSNNIRFWESDFGFDKDTCKWLPHLSVGAIGTHPAVNNDFISDFHILPKIFGITINNLHPHVEAEKKEEIDTEPPATPTQPIVTVLDGKDGGTYVGDSSKLLPAGEKKIYADVASKIGADTKEVTIVGHTSLHRLPSNIFADTFNGDQTYSGSTEDYHYVLSACRCLVAFKFMCDKSAGFKANTLDKLPDSSKQFFTDSSNYVISGYSSINPSILSAATDRKKQIEPVIQDLATVGVKITPKGYKEPFKFINYKQPNKLLPDEDQFVDSLADIESDHGLEQGINPGTPLYAFYANGNSIKNGRVRIDTKNPAAVANRRVSITAINKTPGTTPKKEPSDTTDITPEKKDAAICIELADRSPYDKLKEQVFGVPTECNSKVSGFNLHRPKFIVMLPPLYLSDTHPINTQFKGSLNLLENEVASIKSLLEILKGHLQFKLYETPMGDVIFEPFGYDYSPWNQVTAFGSATGKYFKRAEYENVGQTFVEQHPDIKVTIVPPTYISTVTQNRDFGRIKLPIVRPVENDKELTRHPYYFSGINEKQISYTFDPNQIQTRIVVTGLPGSSKGIASGFLNGPEFVQSFQELGRIKVSTSAQVQKGVRDLVNEAIPTGIYVADGFEEFTRNLDIERKLSIYENKIKLMTESLAESILKSDAERFKSSMSETKTPDTKFPQGTILKLIEFVYPLLVEDDKLYASSLQEKNKAAKEENEKNGVSTSNEVVYTVLPERFPSNNLSLLHKEDAKTKKTLLEDILDRLHNQQITGISAPKSLFPLMEIEVKNKEPKKKSANAAPTTRSYPSYNYPLPVADKKESTKQKIRQGRISELNFADPAVLIFDKQKDTAEIRRSKILKAEENLRLLVYAYAGYFVRKSGPGVYTLNQKKKLLEALFSEEKTSGKKFSKSVAYNTLDQTGKNIVDLVRKLPVIPQITNQAMLNKARVQGLYNPMADFVSLYGIKESQPIHVPYLKDNFTCQVYAVALFNQFYNNAFTYTYSGLPMTPEILVNRTGLFDFYNCIALMSKITHTWAPQGDPSTSVTTSYIRKNIFNNIQKEDRFNITDFDYPKGITQEQAVEKLVNDSSGGFSSNYSAYRVLGVFYESFTPRTSDVDSEDVDLQNIQSRLAQLITLRSLYESILILSIADLTILADDVLLIQNQMDTLSKHMESVLVKLKKVGEATALIDAKIKPHLIALNGDGTPDNIGFLKVRDNYIALIDQIESIPFDKRTPEQIAKLNHAQEQLPRTIANIDFENNEIKPLQAEKDKLTKAAASDSVQPATQETLNELYKNLSDQYAQAKVQLSGKLRLFYLNYSLNFGIDDVGIKNKKPGDPINDVTGVNRFNTSIRKMKVTKIEDVKILTNDWNEARLSNARLRFFKDTYVGKATNYGGVNFAEDDLPAAPGLYDIADKIRVMQAGGKEIDGGLEILDDPKPPAQVLPAIDPPSAVTPESPQNTDVADLTDQIIKEVNQAYGENSKVAHTIKVENLRSGPNLVGKRISIYSRTLDCGVLINIFSTGTSKGKADILAIKSKATIAKREKVPHPNTVSTLKASKFVENLDAGKFDKVK